MMLIMFYKQLMDTRYVGYPKAIFKDFMVVGFLSKVTLGCGLVFYVFFKKQFVKDM